MTLTVDLASMGTTFLFLTISFVAGLAVAIAGAVLGGAGELLLGFAKAVAGAFWLMPPNNWTPDANV